MSSRRHVLVALVATLVVLLAGCSGAGSKELDDADSQVQLRNPEATGPAPAIDGAQFGGSVRIVLPEDARPTSLEPASITDPRIQSLMQGLVMRSLTTLTWDEHQNRLVLVPDLATDLGQPNADFTQWSYTLKDDLYYENAQPITAEDVAWAISRAFDGNNGTIGGNIRGPHLMYLARYFVGGDHYNGPYDAKPRTLSPAVSVSGKTVTIDTTRPFADMDYLLASVTLSPVPMGRVSKPPAYGQAPWSSGPYRVTQFSPTQDLILERNRHWVEQSDPSRHNYPQRIIVEFSDDQSALSRLVRRGDTTTTTTVLPQLKPAQYAKAHSAIGEQVLVGPTACAAFIAPNVDRISDIRLRQAIAYAYPYEEVWLAQGQLPGITRQHSHGIDLIGWNLAHPTPAASSEFTLRQDIDKARQLIQDAGVPLDSYQLTWVYDSREPTDSYIAERVAEAFTSAGFVANPLPYEGRPSEVWLADPTAASEAGRLARRTNLDGIYWCADWPSGLTALAPLLASEARYNTSGFSDKTIDARIAEIPTLPLAEQPQAWRRLAQDVTEHHLPLINLGQQFNLYAHGSKVGGILPDPLLGTVYYRNMYVTK